MKKYVVLKQYQGILEVDGASYFMDKAINYATERAQQCSDARFFVAKLEVELKYETVITETKILKTIPLNTNE